MNEIEDLVKYIGDIILEELIKLLFRKLIVFFCDVVVIVFLFLVVYFFINFDID